MKLTGKLLCAALASAIAGPAAATIKTNTSGDGELFFTIIDRDPEPLVNGDDSRSYTRDLGVSISQFLPTGDRVAPGHTVTFSPDQLLQSFLSEITDPGRRSRVAWNIGAMDSVGTQRYLTTAREISVVDTPSNQALRAFDDNASIYIFNVNSKGTHPGGDAVNGSSASGVADGPAYGGAANWGNNWGGASVFGTSAPIGDSLRFFLLSTNAGTNSAKATLDKFDNNFGDALWTFADDGNLTYLAPVPEPHEWTLMVAGLGLVGWAARRRKS